MGGEERTRGSELSWCRGLPPRGRGRDYHLPWSSEFKRITPAWAGKSRRGRALPQAYQDYPRVGGEETTPACLRMAEKGLPPRGRGRAGEVTPKWALMRITPAWAGKRAEFPSDFALVQDYPRVGGEEARCQISSDWA